MDQDSNSIFSLNKLVLFNFFILTFFTFMGTTVPFKESTIDAYAGETTNIVNQILYMYLFLSAIIVIVQSPRRVSVLIQQEKFLSIFILICLLSAIWSDHGFLSIKRSFQLLATLLTLFNLLLHARLHSMITVLKIVCMFYILTTYVSGFMIPQAIDPEFGTWRGIEITKNLLGHTALIIFILTLFFYSEESNPRSKLLSQILASMSIGIIIFSGSSTSLVGLFLVVLIQLIFYFEKAFRTIGLGKTFIIFIIIFLSVTAITVSFFSSDLLAQVTGLLGKDPSLTGRSTIWDYIWNEIQKKIIVGYGFGTYWIMGTSVIDRFIVNVGWRVNEAHNGYLEIMLELGIVGFIFFVSLLSSFIYRVIKVDHKIALIVIITILVVNFSESFLFQSRGASTLIFMFFYLLVSFLYSYEKPEENY